MNKPKFPELVDDQPRGVLLELEPYRQKREKEGTWPLSREEHFRFWYEWRERRNK